MRNFRSITYKITGVMFLLVMMNVFFITSYARQRVAGLFHDYLLSQNLPARFIFGRPEQHFLFTFHESLVWLGIICAIIALLSSYWLARSITIPLRKLNMAVENIEKGQLGEKAEVMSRDEIGHLATVFNRVTEALAVNQRLRKRLLADIAHELSTPLTIIQGNLEGMLCGIVSKGDEQLQSMYEEVTHLSKLIGDLRDLSLAEAGQLELEQGPVDIDSFLKNRIVQTVLPLANDKGLTLTYEDACVPLIQADSKRLYQIFNNLLSNAFHYTPPGGTITIKLNTIGAAGNRWVKVEIGDSGAGIAEEDLPYIFERFYRSHRSRDKKSGGSGIGLAIVKELVEIHGGRVTVSSCLGEGSIFTVYLPVADTKI